MAVHSQLAHSMVFASRDTKLARVVSLSDGSFSHCASKGLQCQYLYYSHGRPTVCRGELWVRVPTKFIQVLETSSSLQCGHACSGLNTSVPVGAPCQAPHPPPALGVCTVLANQRPAPVHLLTLELRDLFHVILSSASCLPPAFKWSFIRKLSGIQSIFPPLKTDITGD